MSCNCKSSLELEARTAKSRTRVPILNSDRSKLLPRYPMVLQISSGKGFYIDWRFEYGFYKIVGSGRMHKWYIWVAYAGSVELIYRELRQLFLGR